MKNLNEHFLAILVVVASLAYLMWVNYTSPQFQDGSTVVDAAKDAVTVRFLLLAALDLHCAVLIWLFGGKDFKIVKEFAASRGGRIAIGLILGAWIIASSGVLHK